MVDYQSLKNKLIYYCNRYFNDDVSEISDPEYDKLLVQLKAMEKNQGFADPDSPSQTVGSSIKHGRKVKHSEKMYSLNNVFSTNELNSFFSKYPDETYISEPKIDGMSGNLVYKKGKLILGVSRGDGFIGQNITENVLVIDSVPTKMDTDEDFEIRGEFVIHKSDFNLINEKRIADGLEPFKNARNLVSGTMRGLNPKDVIERSVRFYAYGSPSWKDLDYIPKRKKIESFGFHHVNSLVIDGLDKVELIAQTIKNAQEQYPYEIDGVVVKINSASVQQALGYTSKDPKWAVARKWNSEAVVSDLLDIEDQVGRSGVITPVAKISPTEIGGVTVSSATLHNYDEIKRLGLVRGCKVRLVRSGEVIPKIEGIYFDENNPATVTELFKEPTECPHCKSPVTSIGVKYYCTNKYCSGQLKAQLIYFASRTAMNIMDLDEATIAQLLLKGFVRSFADFYRVTKRNLLALDGFGEKSAQKILDSIEATKQPPLEKFITALGIPNVGVSTAKSLAKRFHCIENLRTATTLELIAIDDIGQKTAEDIHRYFNSETTSKALDDLLQYVKPTYTPNNNGTELKGFTFVITGSFDVDRKEIGDILEAYGGKVSGSVSGKTTLLIQGNNPGDNKVKDAIKNNVKILDYSGKSLNAIVEGVFSELNVPKPHLPF